MLQTEAIQRIRILSERHLGSKSIAKATGLSRNTVRKYLEYIRQGQPIPTAVRRRSKLDPYKEQIHSWFLSCRGHCPVVQRKIQEQLNVSVSLRMLQKYCRQWRIKDLAHPEMTERYEVPPGDEMQIDFGFDDIFLNGNKTRICFFVAVLSYSRRRHIRPRCKRHGLMELSPLSNTLTASRLLLFQTILAVWLMAEVKTVKLSLIVAIFSYLATGNLFRLIANLTELKRKARLSVWLVTLKLAVFPD